MATSKLDNRSRNILTFRPQITFIEPAIISEPIEVIADLAATELEAALADRNKVRSLAGAVEKLASATQIRVDQRAKGTTIALDPKVDAHVIQAVRREFPQEDPVLITYEEYKTCREKISQLGEKIAAKSLMTQDKIDIAANIPLHQIGGFGTPESKDGRLRPEADSDAQIVEPLDMDSFQDGTLKALMNTLWEKMVRPMIVLAVLPPAGELLPKKLFPEENMKVPENLLADIPKEIKIQNEPTKKVQQKKSQKRVVSGQKKKLTNALGLQDCQTIVKAFERGAAFAQTEESVFALLTPHLQTMITQSRSAINQVDSYGVYASKKDIKDKIQDDLQKNTSNLSAPPRGVKAPGINVQGLSTSNANDEPLFTDFVPVDPKTGKREWDRIFDSRCIPCGLRISLSDQAFTSLAMEDNPLFKHMINWFLQQKRYIDDMIHFLKGIQPTDLCVLIEMLTDFVCVPDLARILSLLSTLLVKLSLELSSTFDIIMSLVAPLVTPLISGLVSMVHQFIMMIIRPVECIIDALVAMIRKLDYNTLFDTAANLSFKLDAELAPSGASLTLGGSAGIETPTGHAKQQLQRDVDKATLELQKAKESKNRTDSTDAIAIDEANSRVKDKEASLHSTQTAQDESAVGQIASALEGTKPMLYQLVDFLNEITQTITGFELKLISELKKLQGQYLGGTGSAISANFKKLEIIQMMSLVSMLIQLFSQKPNCSPREAIETAVVKMSSDSFTFYTDEEGNVHIDENQDNIEDVIDEVIVALGGQDGGTKVKSTGDPVLDTEISKTIDALITPSSSVLRCSLQTTTANAEKVNQWIDELNAE